MVSAGGKGHDPGGDPSVVCRDIFEGLFEPVHRAEGHVTDIGDPVGDAGRRPGAVVVGTYASGLDAQLSGPHPGPGPVGDPEIEGHTDEREIEVFQRFPVWQAKERGDSAVRVVHHVFRECFELRCEFFEIAVHCR